MTLRGQQAETLYDGAFSNATRSSDHLSMPSATNCLSKLDAVYRSYLLTRYFVKGWGDPANIQKICKFRKIVSDRRKCTQLVQGNYPIHIDREWKRGSYRLIEGHFISPLVHYMADIVPQESHKAYFQLLVPNEWRHPKLRPVCLQLAGTGDHRFWRRTMFIAKPLLSEYGIGSIMLENPYYGYRKPKAQVRSVLQNVSDVFVMGGCLVLESIALLRWCEQQGYGPLALTGISMGGHMASLAGGSYDRPVGIVPCLSWTTASCVFTQGVMANAINWDLLQIQFTGDEKFKAELSKMVETPEPKDMRTFLAGQNFARQVSHEIASHDRRERSHAVIDGVDDAAWDETSLSTTLARLVESLPIEFLQLRSPPSREEVVEAWNFMRGIMDECTHLGNFGTPVDPTLAICVAATRDAYVPREGTRDIRDIWPGCEVRYIDCGHVTGFVFKQHRFRKAIADSLNRTAIKYYSEHLFGVKDIGDNTQHNRVERALVR
ncbi:protein ABHD18-like isoform X1 [Varroa jacobsoni]|uniref:protein ABHD18-like isoform X1 n=2 Tax=Varroa jacobsoni TaxID=62625 RepID=UPI000BF64720|nr:protein ABHD18-like isoform X1 [Varroa jacobsoni]